MCLLTSIITKWKPTFVLLYKIEHLNTIISLGVQGDLHRQTYPCLCDFGEYLKIQTFPCAAEWSCGKTSSRIESWLQGPQKASIPEIQWIMLHTYGRQNRIWHLVTFKLLFLKAMLVSFWMFLMNLGVYFLDLSQSILLFRVNLKSECSSILLPISHPLQRKILGAEIVLFVPVLTLM